jgi:hypothetical protein
MAVNECASGTEANALGRYGGFSFFGLEMSDSSRRRNVLPKGF